MPLFGRKNKNRDAEEKEPARTSGDTSPQPEEKPAAAPAESASDPEIPAPAIPEASADARLEESAAVPEENRTPAPSPERPAFHTPEGFDFNRYFLAERRIMLENVSYETSRPAGGQLRLNCRDTIVSQLLGPAGVKVTFNRTLSFEPEGPFRLSVSFSVLLVFNPGTRGEIDWKTIDVAEEFKKNCPQLVQAMVTKTTLLIAEITNANGTPILPIR